MNRSFSQPRTSVLIVAIAVVVAVTGQGCTSRPQTPTPFGTPSATESLSLASEDAEAQLFASERDISLADAKRRLGWQTLAPDLEQALQAEPFFGGVWIDRADGDRVKVGVVGDITAETRDRVARAASQVGLTEGFAPVSVRFTQRDLDEANEWIGKELERVNVGTEATMKVGERTDGNVIEVEVPADELLTSNQRNMLDEARARFGARLHFSADSGPVVAQQCIYPFCDPPLRGGIKIFGPANCTGGFVVQSRSTARYYQFTAGHCYWDNIVTTGVMNTGIFSTLYSDQTTHDIGPIHNWMPIIKSPFGTFSDGDAAILEILDPATWQPQARIEVTLNVPIFGKIVTVTIPDYYIKSDNYSQVGMFVCASGAVTGRSSCGYVLWRGLTVTYTDGVTVHHLAKASYCSKGGDSGAPVFANHVAYGIHVSAPAKNPCLPSFQGVRAAEDALNVDIMHLPV